jgi:hypothetical protein
MSEHMKAMTVRRYGSVWARPCEGAEYVQLAREKIEMVLLPVKQDLGHRI